MYLPAICRSVVCILYPVIMYPSTSDIPYGKGYSEAPFTSNGPKSIGLQIQLPVVSSLGSGSFAEDFLANLEQVNPIVNATMHVPSIRVGTIVRPVKIRFPVGYPLKIYGEGSESKFPPFLEFLLQRIQSYFSVYNYQDTSRPVLGDLNTMEEGSEVVEGSNKYTSDYNEIDVEESGPYAEDEELDDNLISEDGVDEFIVVGEDDNDNSLELRFNSMLRG